MSHPPKVRNLRTRALNRRDTFWQIALPLALVVMAALGLMGLVIAGTTTPPRTSALADVSLMFLILLAAVAGLVLLTLVAGLCVGVWLGLRELPYLFKRVQDYAALVAYHTRRVMDPLAQGVLTAGSFAAALRRAVTSLRALLLLE